MEPKVYCEHRFVLDYEGLHFDVLVKAYSQVMGYQGRRPNYGKPRINVDIGGETMTFGAFLGADPAMTLEDARLYVQQNLKTWEHTGPFDLHLSQEAAARRRKRRG